MASRRGPAKTGRSHPRVETRRRIHFFQISAHNAWSGEDNKISCCPTLSKSTPIAYGSFLSQRQPLPPCWYHPVSLPAWDMRLWVPFLWLSLWVILDLGRVISLDNIHLTPKGGYSVCQKYLKLCTQREGSKLRLMCLDRSNQPMISFYVNLSL